MNLVVQLFAMEEAEEAQSSFKNYRIYQSQKCSLSTFSIMEVAVVESEN